MCHSLNNLLKEERKRIEQLATWNKAMHTIEAETFPLTLPDSDEGAWLEMLAEFNPEQERYQIPTNDTTRATRQS